MNLPLVQKKAAELSKLANEAEGLQKRYGAYLALYDAACMAGNEAEITQRRDECHTLLDGILDNTRTVHYISREVQDLLAG
jgi:hypothetical protein